MMHRSCISSCVFWLASFAFGADAGKAIDFARDIQPILSDNCYFCHGPDGGHRKADLRLDSLDETIGPFAARDGYSIITPGNLDESVLVMRITSDDDEVRMPPVKSNRKLSEKQVELLKTWIEQGAKWGKHWSFEAPKRGEVPEVNDRAWQSNPIDRFILARLEREGLSPSPEASKETLIRRVTLDLTGLPPTIEEIDAFLADESPDAYAKVVDRLLASPRYGERMVWEWLDIARYADTNGYQGDATRTMWPWRDWAIDAMNDNMSFDQFVIKQLAGDLIEKGTREDKIATAFLRNHMINGEGGRIAEENRIDYVMDQTETVSTAFLGLTVGCARCHDHKFDPISQKDYYALSAFFNNTPVDGRGGSGQNPPVIDFATEAQNKKVAELGEEVTVQAAVVTEMETKIFPRSTTQTAADSPAAAKLSGNLSAALREKPEKRAGAFLIEIINTFKESQPQYVAATEKLKSAIEKRDQFNSAIPRVMVMEELPTPRETFLLVKGSYDKHGEKVSPRTPTTLPALSTDVKKDRLALAKWLFSAEHPLTARVAVNRYWQQFFGVGIVKTVDDFGVQGERPMHPELLDWLAVEFRESGWDVKKMHRLIVTSSAYRQSSKMTAESFERDPENRLLSRGPRYRLPAFMLRDQMLAASGLLVEKLGGPAVKTYQPDGVWEEATFGLIKYEPDHGAALYRRSVYTFWRRIVGPTQFFDASPRQVCTMKPSRTNTPLHALTTLNDVAWIEGSRAMAQRVMLAETSPEKRVELAYRLTMARKPTKQEMAIVLEGLERLKAEYAKDPEAAKKLLGEGESKRDEKLDPVEQAAYAGVCLTILNLDEALTKE